MFGNSELAPKGSSTFGTHQDSDTSYSMDSGNSQHAHRAENYKEQNGSGESTTDRVCSLGVLQVSTNWTDWLNDFLQDDDRRRGFGAEKIKTSFALALLDARESLGITQSELAEMCGVSQAYISKLESGEANPTIGKIGSIFAAMWMKPSVGFGPLMPESTATGSIANQDKDKPVLASSLPGDD